MESSNLIKIQDAVDRYVYKWKVPMDDWGLYFEHAADCVRTMNIHHLRTFKTAKVTSVSSGLFDLPRDVVDIISISVPYNGRLWTLSEDGTIDITSMEGYPNNEVSPDLVYMEEFLDKETVIRNGGTLDDTVTFSSNKAVLDGTAGWLNMPLILNNDVYTVEIGLAVDSPSDTSYLLDFTTTADGVGSLSMTSSALSTTSGTVYVNGAATTAVDTATTHIVIAGMTLEAAAMLVGCKDGFTNFFDGSIDYVRIYDRTWTATDVTSGYTTHQAREATTADDLLDTKTTDYGAKGGNNLYYYSPDWKRRKVFINGIPTETVIMQYVSSGLSLTGDTYIPAHALPVIDRYLRWKQAEIDGTGINERRDRERLYSDEVKMLRRTQLPSLTAFKDTLLSITTQAPIR